MLLDAHLSCSARWRRGRTYTQIHICPPRRRKQFNSNCWHQLSSVASLPTPSPSRLLRLEQTKLVENSDIHARQRQQRSESLVCNDGWAGQRELKRHYIHAHGVLARAMAAAAPPSTKTMARVWVSVSSGGGLSDPNRLTTKVTEVDKRRWEDCSAWLRSFPPFYHPSASADARSAAETLSFFHFEAERTLTHITEKILYGQNYQIVPILIALYTSCKRVACVLYRDRIARAAPQH